MSNSWKKKLLIIVFVIIIIVASLFAIKIYQKNKNKYGKFVKTGSTHYVRSLHESVLLPNGKVLIFDRNTKTTKPAEIYDPKTGKFTVSGKLDPKPRWGFSYTPLKDGKLMIIGGQRRGSAAENPLKSVLIFDPETGKSKNVGNMNYYRSYYVAGAYSIQLDDGRVLILGGAMEDKLNKHNLRLFRKEDIAELYDPKTNKFTIIKSKRTNRELLTLLKLKNGNVAVIGATGRNFYLKTRKSRSLEIFNPKTNKFIYKNVDIPDLIYLAVNNNNDEIIIVAQVRRTPKEPNIHDEKIRFIIIKPPYTKINQDIVLTEKCNFFTRRYHIGSLVLIDNNKILVSGGQRGQFPLFKYVIKDAIIFDLKNKKMHKIKNLNIKRSGHSSTILKDGKVLIIGGTNLDNTSELFIKN